MARREITFEHWKQGERPKNQPPWSRAGGGKGKRDFDVPPPGWSNGPPPGNNGVKDPVEETDGALIGTFPRFW